MLCRLRVLQRPRSEINSNAQPLKFTLPFFLATTKFDRKKNNEKKRDFKTNPNIKAQPIQSKFKEYKVTV